MLQKKNSNLLNVGMFLILAFLFTAAASQDQIPRYISQDPSGGILLEVNANKTDVYPDEAVTLTYNLLTRYDTRFEGAESEEASEGFWFKDVEFPREIASQKVKRNDRSYIQATVRKKIFFPRQTGTLKLQPADLNIRLKVKNKILLELVSKSQFIHLTAQPIEIKVREFPPAPPGFTGSLGQYTIQASVKEKRSPKGGYIFTVKINGEGNLWNVKLPKIDFGESFEILSVSEKVFDVGYWDEEAVKGNKVFNFELLPKRIGQLTLPGVTFVFFNLLNQQYETTASQPVTVNVTSLPSPIGVSHYDSGLAILVDRSGSMRSEDFGDGSREAGAKKIAKEMVMQSEAKWLFTALFAGDILQKTITSDEKQSLIDFIESQHPLNDGTSMGDALQTAVEALERSIASTGSKKILLIGDGVNNKGHLTSQDAAKMAADKKIKIFSLGLGRGGRVRFPVDDPVKGRKYLEAESPVNFSELEEVSKITGGKFFHVKDPEQLDAIIQELKILLRNI